MGKRDDRSSAQEALLWAAVAFPELSLTQLIVNATGRNDPYHVTDAKLAEDLDAYRRRYAGKQKEPKP